MLFKHCNALPSTSTTPSLKLAKAGFDVLPNSQATENHAICMASLHFLLVSVPHSRPCCSGATTNSSAPQARSGTEGHSAGVSARLISCSGHGIDPRVPTPAPEQVRPDLADLVTKSSSSNALCRRSRTTEAARCLTHSSGYCPFFFWGGLFYLFRSYEIPTGAAPTLLEWSMGWQTQKPLNMPAITTT